MRVKLNEVKSTGSKTNKKRDKKTSKVKADMVHIEHVLKDVEEVGDKQVYLFFDQSTKTGYSLWDEDKNLILVGLLKLNQSSMLDYKNKLRDIILTIKNNYSLTELWYEEVYDDKNKKTTEVLYYIKHTIQDLSKEGISIFGFDHATWKRELSGSQIKKGDNHKKEIAKYVNEYFKEINKYEELEKLGVFKQQDMMDSLGMGIARLVKCEGMSYYNLARYNKNLPIHEKLIFVESIDEVLTEDYKLNKPFEVAKNVGGVKLVELDMNRQLNVNVRKILSHEDSLLVAKIPQSYRYFGMLLLSNGVDITTGILDTHDAVMLYARKKRI